MLFRLSVHPHGSPASSSSAEPASSESLISHTRKQRSPTSPTRPQCQSAARILLAPLPIDTDMAEQDHNTGQKKELKPCTSRLVYAVDRGALDSVEPPAFVPSRTSPTPPISDSSLFAPSLLTQNAVDSAIAITAEPSSQAAGSDDPPNSDRLTRLHESITLAHAHCVLITPSHSVQMRSLVSDSTVRFAHACRDCKKAKARCDLKRPCDRSAHTEKAPAQQPREQHLTASSAHRSVCALNAAVFALAWKTVAWSQSTRSAAADTAPTSMQRKRSALIVALCTLLNPT
jgi:hypothetical protein